jgi:hypothetical protein
VTTVEAIQLTLIVIAAALAVLRLISARRRPDDLAAAALYRVTVCLAISLSLGYPAFYQWVYRLLAEVPGLPQLVQHISMMVMAYQLQVFALAIVNDGDLRPRLARRRRILLLGLAGLVVTYLLGPLRLGLPVLSAHGNRDAGVAVYVTVVQLYVLVAVVDVLRLCWAHRDTGPRLLRTGLRFMGLGCAFGVLFSAHKILYFVATTAGAQLPWDDTGPTGIQLLFLAPAVVLISAGIMIPRWGPPIVLLLRRHATHRRLAPLASALRTAAPNTTQVEPHALQGIHARLLSRVIGIRDALVGPLRPYLDMKIYEAALLQATLLGLPAEDAAAIAEAACIAAAAATAATGPEARPTPSPPPLFYGHDLDSEAVWLAKVSDAYTNSDLARHTASTPAPHTTDRQHSGWPRE